MNKYIIFANDGGLACEKRVDGQTVGFIETEDRFISLARSFIGSGYKIKIKNKDMALIRDSDMIILRDFFKIINHQLLRELARDIERTMSSNGYVDISKKDDLNKKANRQKSNSGLPKIIKTVGKVAVGVGSALILYNAISAHVNKPESQGVEPQIPTQNEQQEKSLPKETPQKDNATAYISYQVENDTLENQIEVASQEETQTETTSYEYLNASTEPITENSYEESLSDLPKEEVPTAYLEFVNNSQTEKAKKAKELYMPYFEDCAERFGLDANLLLAMGTQERGVHSDVKESDGGIGLMQIQYDVWINKTVDYFEKNPETGKFEKKSITITDAMLKDVKSNIEVGSIILQIYLRISKYNIPVAIQMYNMGDGALKSILRTYGEVCGKTLDELFDSPTDLGWTEYRQLKNGDPIYLENVNQWAENPTFSVINLDTMETVSFAFTNEETLSHHI